jgi:hypothetical protein
MRQLILGAIVGSLLTTGLGVAGTFYDSKGQPNAPRGSIQQQDYFRLREQFLDTQAIRRNQEEQRRHDRLNPCGR